MRGVRPCTRSPRFWSPFLSVICPHQVNGTMVTNSSHLEVVKLIKCELESWPLMEWEADGGCWPGGFLPEWAAAAATSLTLRGTAHLECHNPSTISGGDTAGLSSASLFFPIFARPVRPQPTETTPHSATVHRHSFSFLPVWRKKAKQYASGKTWP